MKSLVAAAVLVVTASATAHAQPGSDVPQPYAQPVASPDELSEDTAVALSLGGTVASWGLLIAASRTDNSEMGTIGAIGTLLAPSFGHWYAHDALTRGLGLRVLGLGAATIGLAMALDGIFDEQESSDNGGTGAVLMLVGAGLYVAGTIDDIATAPTAVHKYNARSYNVSVLPTMSQHGGGLAMVGRF